MFQIWLCLICLLASAWPAIRFCLYLPLWRWFPRALLSIVAVLLASAWLSYSLAVYRPWLLPFWVGFVLCLRGMLWLWSAPHFGASQGLPPGCLEALNPGPWSQPDYFLGLAEQFGPVFKTRHLFTPTLCIADLDLGWDFLKSQSHCLESPPLRFDASVPGGALRYQSPDLHQRCRSILGTGLSGPSVEASLPYLEAAVTRGLSRLADRGGENPRFSLDRLAREVMLGVIHGVRPEEARYQHLESLYGSIDGAAVEREFLPWRPQSRRFQQALMAASEQIRLGPRGPVPASLESSHPGALQDPGVTANLALLVDVGTRDLSGLMTWILWMLAVHPGWEQELCPESVVMETLRLEQSEYLFRRTTRDIHWQGYRIPKGWLVRLCVREAHRRCALVGATSFRPQRRPVEGCCRPFGAHQHSCLGQLLTRRIGVLLVQRLARDYCLQLRADGPREFDGWHWRPSSSFRIQLGPRFTTLLDGR